MKLLKVEIRSIEQTGDVGPATQRGRGPLLTALRPYACLVRKFQWRKTFFASGVVVQVDAVRAALLYTVHRGRSRRGSGKDHGDRRDPELDGHPAGPRA